MSSMKLADISGTRWRYIWS